ncbi:EF-hand domain [Trinorchestia longiramus]|nr:EF-hand domain [Trinorchestia longiramus]
MERWVGRLSLKAALLIQRWYRRYCARLEVRRRYTWTIFQSIEYQGEQDQIKLHNFFNALLRHVEHDAASGLVASMSPRHSPTHSDELSRSSLPHDAAIDDIIVENSYKGARLIFPLTVDSIHALVASFKKKKALHLRYVCLLLREATKELQKRPSLNQVSTSISGQVTICGDLHGKLDDLLTILYKVSYSAGYLLELNDLLTILYKNGLPSTDNPYVFNGDFVDRGKKSMEVLLLLLALQQVWPNEVYLNRGNHEDLVMNARYGFCKEVSKKYKGSHGPRVLALIEDVYRHLPLASVIDNAAFVVHGGISQNTDLSKLAQVDRSKYVSILRVPMLDDMETCALDLASITHPNIGMNEPTSELADLAEEWKMVLDLLWSDPQSSSGCEPNTFRGGGTYFGPDVTSEFLDRSGLSFLVRSHECKSDGYELSHDGKCITVFSASNYYGEGSNRGAYMKLQGRPLEPHYVQYTADTKNKHLTLRERVGRMELSAINELKCQIMASRPALLKGFQEADPEGTGHITVSKWVEVMEQASELKLPWRVLKDKLVIIDPKSGLVEYQSTFRTDRRPNIQDGPSVVETLYRHKSSLEAIFRLIDKDNSGYITLDEFRDACGLLERHASLPNEQIADLAASMDINKDGRIDFNEFLECFRIVESGFDQPDEDESEEDDD